MLRHQSLYDLGDVDTFFADNAPRHAYFSAARYDDPGASTMSQKGWRSADLVFDLDADHLPWRRPGRNLPTPRCSPSASRRSCDSSTSSKMTSRSTTSPSSSPADAGTTSTFATRACESWTARRREVVDYVRAIDLDTEGLIRTVSERGTTKRVLRTEGGWGARVHEALIEYADDLREMDAEDARERLMELDGIGEGRAETILGPSTATPPRSARAT